MTEADRDIIVKKFGFFGGLVIVDLAVRYYRFGWRCPERLDALTRTELIDLQSMMNIEAVILAWISSQPSRRAIRLESLADELQSVIDAAPAHASGARLSAERAPPVRDSDAVLTAIAPQEIAVAA